MKKILTTIALLSCLNIASLIHAETTIIIDGIEYGLGEETANVVGYDKNLEEIDIPETIQVDGKDYTVVSIAERLFFNSTITSINLPAKLTEIGKYAFYGSKGLTEMIIPNSVVSIGESAFEKCTSIETLSISSSLPIIEERTFHQCFSIKSVTIPPSVKEIGKAAFESCYSMEALSLPSSLEKIEQGAFYGCDNLTSLTIPSSVTEIGPSAFWNCLKLKSATISSSLTEIPSGMFYGCHDLTNVVIPSSVSYIGERAFEQCLSLPILILPPSITTIDEDAFKNCEMLTTIVSYPDVAPSVGRNAFYRVPEDAVVYVPAGTLEQYASAEGWTGFHDFRELGSIALTISSTQLNLKVNETATLTVEVDKAYDVVIESEAWWTSNPEVAVVEDGKVTAVGEGNATILYTVIDGTGCPHVASCDVFVDGTAGIEGVSSDDSESGLIQYFNLNGVRVNPDALTPGLYIKIEGKRSKKVLIK